MNMEDRNSERLARVEEKTENNTSRIERLEDTTSVLGEMKAILEMQVKINEKQSAQMEQSDRTFMIMNENLTRLSSVTNQLQESIVTINNRVDGVVAEQEKGKISVDGIGVKLFYGFAMLIPTIVGAWIMMKGGLK